MYFKNMDNECRTPIKIPAIKAIKKPTGSASKTTSGKINVKTMEEFKYDIPDYVKKLDHKMISRQSTPTNKTDNKVTDVRSSYSNSNLDSFITYKNENKVGRIATSKLDKLHQYLYAHMIDGFDLDYHKIANNTFIHKSDKLADTLLCVLNNRNLYVLALHNQILFSINLDNDYVHLETYDFEQEIELFFNSDYIDKEKHFYSTLEYIINKMRSTYGLRTNIDFLQNKCELSFVKPDFIRSQKNPEHKIPAFFDIDLKRTLTLDANFSDELEYFENYRDFIETLPINKKINSILSSYKKAELNFKQKLSDLRTKTYINEGEIEQYSGYIFSSTDTQNTFVFREFDDLDSNKVAYGAKSEAKNRIDLAIANDILKFRDDSEDLINSYIEFINKSGVVNDELLKDIYIDKLKQLQSNLADKLNAFDNERETIVI
jgi:hypothetical protein